MLVPTSLTKGLLPVVVMVVDSPTITTQIVVVDALIQTEAGGVADKIFLLIGQFVKSVRKLVMLHYSVITVLTTHTPLIILLPCKLSLPLLNRLLILIGIQTQVPLIMSQMILPI